MNRKHVKKQIKELKSQLKSVNKTTNARILKLTALMLILLFLAALVYGRVQF